MVDLFAGSGAMGIEALSRGASRAVFVDDDAAAIASIRANLAATGLGARAEVVRQRAEIWLASGGMADRVEVVFCDPPYAFDRWDDLLGGVNAGLAVIESDRAVHPAGWDVARSRRYGTTFVTFAEPLSARPDPEPPTEAGE